jgi:hypothetical protein
MAERDSQQVKNYSALFKSSYFFKATTLYPGGISRPKAPVSMVAGGNDQGCQIFLGKKYQNGKNIPNYIQQKISKWT